MTAPKPTNFEALSNAWNDPTAFATELAAYYDQLAHRERPTLVDITEPRRGIR